VSLCYSFVGVILVSYSDQNPLPSNDPTGATTTTPPVSSALIGDILALLGALFYGCYTTMLKVRIGDESRIDMPLFFGFVGAFNVLLLWPVFPVLDWLGIETFQLPFTPTLWIIVLLNAFIGTFLSDYLWLLSMLMTSPLVVTLGISLTVIQ
jgi:solute carrier family 35 protein F5